jgi:hypothetical protein
MGTLSARALRESLKKAENIGIIEERVTLFDTLEVIVRNLRPDEYEAIYAECKGLEDVDYLYGFQLAHVKRAIVEMNGVDLRGVQYVEDEEDDPKKPGQTKTIKLELPDWLLKNYISTWGKEAVFIVYRKVEDAVERAEKKAKDGITFLTPDETSEDRFRRLVGEVKELEEGLPQKLVDNVLDDAGYMRKSTAEEVKRAMGAADKLAREQQQARGGGAGAPPVPPSPAPPPAAPPAPPVAAAAAPAPVGPDPNDLVRNRQPMNTAAVDVSQPVIVSPQPRQNVVPAQGQRVPQPEKPIPGAIPGPPVHGSAGARAMKNAALEAEADASGALTGPGGALPARPSNVPILEKKQPVADPKAAMSVMDPAPKGGINPHYRPPPRGV